MGLCKDCSKSSFIGFCCIGCLIKASSPASNDALRTGTSLTSPSLEVFLRMGEEGWPDPLYIFAFPCEYDRGRLLGISNGGWLRTASFDGLPEV